MSVAFILSLVAQWQCKYVDITNNDNNFGEGGMVDQAGIHCYQAGGGNWAYSVDVVSDTTQSLSYATVAMGGIAWLIFLLAICCKFPGPVWLLTGLLLAATAVTEGLVFREVFNSDFCTAGSGDSCAWGVGAKCAISAMTFWSLSSLMTCAMFKEAKESGGNEEGGDEEEG